MVPSSAGFVKTPVRSALRANTLPIRQSRRCWEDRLASQSEMKSAVCEFTIASDKNLGWIQGRSKGFSRQRRTVPSVE